MQHPRSNALALCLLAQLASGCGKDVVYVADRQGAAMDAMDATGTTPGAAATGPFGTPGGSGGMSGLEPSRTGLGATGELDAWSADASTPGVLADAGLADAGLADAGLADAGTAMLDGEAPALEQDEDGGALEPDCDGPEVCNGEDDDCDGRTDEGATTAYFRDADRDGYGNPTRARRACAPPWGYVADDQDCDDVRPDIHPGGWESCNARDDDCDATTPDGSDEDWLGAACDGNDADLCLEGVLGCQAGIQICDDDSGDDLETCNGEDDDCDNVIDETTTTVFFLDADGDGYGDPAWQVSLCEAEPGYVLDGQDCDDGLPEVHPGADELCNGENDDCDLATDEGC